MHQGQDLNELFDILPPPEATGRVENPESIMHANSDARWPTATRKEAHEHGLWHRSVGLWLFTKDGRVAIQRRSLFKDTNPGKWQKSVAGHVSSGQSVFDAVLNEAREELGIELERDDVEFIAALPLIGRGATPRFGKYVDKEYKFIFMCMIEERNFDFNPDEVSAVEFRLLHDVFEKFMSGDSEFCPMSHEYIEIVQEAISRRLDQLRT